MIKFIIGPKGTGKTRTAIDMANKALEDCKGENCIVNGWQSTYAGSQLPDSIREHKGI